MLRRVRTWWKFRKAVATASRGDMTCVPGEKDIVVLPCWRRPEFLWHCLNNLTRAEGIDSVHVLFRLDTGFSSDNLDVIQSFSDRLASFEVQVADSCPYRRSKQSANVLLGYLNAARKACQFVFLVEEDIMVARDFFRWHRAVHAQQRELFCSISAKNPNRDVAVPPNADDYYRSTGDYCSLGVCMDRRVIKNLITPHVNVRYFRKPKRYLRRHFPNSTVSLSFVEQDGLIRRIQAESKLPLVYPCVPRSYHAGFYGYNRPGGVDGSLADKVRHIGSIVYSVDAMGMVARHAGIAADSVPVSLDSSDWTTLTEIDIGLPD